LFYPTSYGKTVIYTQLPFYVEQLRLRAEIKIIVILSFNTILQQKIERFGSLMCSMRMVINGGSERETERQQFIAGSFCYLVGHRDEPKEPVPPQISTEPAKYVNYQDTKYVLPLLVGLGVGLVVYFMK
jgi:hypothetical protein